MASLRIEHVNVTVSDPDRTAALMQRLFGWKVRWRGPARDNGLTVHVGNGDHYLALYSPLDGKAHHYAKGEPLNHVGIEVDDIDATETKVIEAGLIPFSHGDYDPGRRFYFLDPDGTEYEVVSYG
jgi:catechol 2,3-dioxygenase-like lactoylglutathione lyase family enzyme